MTRIVIFMLLFTTSLCANTTYRWADMVEGENYKIDRDLSLEYSKKTFNISKDQKMKLLNFKPLPMINVYLAQFRVLNCTDNNSASEMILVEVDQPSSKKVSVGVDLTYGCKLEVFIEKKDYYTYSIFN